MITPLSKSQMLPIGSLGRQPTRQAMTDGALVWQPIYIEVYTIYEPFGRPLADILQTETCMPGHTWLRQYSSMLWSMKSIFGTKGVLVIHSTRSDSRL